MQTPIDDFDIFIEVSRSAQASPYSSLEHVTPSVLCPNQITKSCHEHYVYVIMHVMEYVDNIFVT